MEKCILYLDERAHLDTQNDVITPFHMLGKMLPGIHLLTPEVLHESRRLMTSALRFSTPWLLPSAPSCCFFNVSGHSLASSFPLAGVPWNTDSPFLFHPRDRKAEEGMEFNVRDVQWLTTLGKLLYHSEDCCLNGYTYVPPSQLMSTDYFENPNVMTWGSVEDQKHLEVDHLKVKTDRKNPLSPRLLSLSVPALFLCPLSDLNTMSTLSLFPKLASILLL